MRIAIQGQQYSFHYVATLQWFENDSIDFVYCKSFEEVFQLVRSSSVDYGVVATHNSDLGDIEIVSALITSYQPTIIDTLTLRVEQNLIGFSKDIDEIYSHPVALQQCSIFLEQHYPNAKLVEWHDTVGAVEYIASLKDPSKAAIASNLAGEEYGLSTIADTINNDSENSTDFIVFSNTN